MENLKFLKRNSKVIKRDKTHTTFATKITEDEFNIFKDEIDNYNEPVFKARYSLTTDNILAYGPTNTITRTILNEIIDSVERRDGTSYTCFVSNWKDNPCTILHEDPRSSWECLKGYMDYPEYLIIFKTTNDVTI